MPGYPCCCGPQPPDDDDYPCHCDRGEDPIDYNRRYPKKMFVEIEVVDAPYPVFGGIGGGGGGAGYVTNLFDFAVGTYELDLSADCNAFLEYTLPGTAVFQGSWTKATPLTDECTVRVSPSGVTILADVFSSQKRACKETIFGSCLTPSSANTYISYNGTGGLNEDSLLNVCLWDGDTRVDEFQKTVNWIYGYLAEWCGCDQTMPVVNSVQNTHKFIITRTIEWHTFP